MYSRNQYRFLLAYVVRRDCNLCWEPRWDFQPLLNHHWLFMFVVKKYLHTQIQ